MHESSLVAGLLRIINEEAQKHKVQSIVRVRLGLGLLACIEEQTLQACFELLAENTVAHGAALHMERIPLACTCEQCQTSFHLEKRHFICPTCASAELHFTGGHGCTLLALEAQEIIAE